MCRECKDYKHAWDKAKRSVDPEYRKKTNRYRTASAKRRNAKLAPIKAAEKAARKATEEAVLAAEKAARKRASLAYAHCMELATCRIRALKIVLAPPYEPKSCSNCSKTLLKGDSNYGRCRKCARYWNKYGTEWVPIDCEAPADRAVRRLCSFDSHMQKISDLGGACSCGETTPYLLTFSNSSLLCISCQLLHIKT